MDTIEVSPTLEPTKADPLISILQESAGYFPDQDQNPNKKPLHSENPAAVMFGGVKDAVIGLFTTIASPLVPMLESISPLGGMLFKKSVEVTTDSNDAINEALSDPPRTKLDE